MREPLILNYYALLRSSHESPSVESVQVTPDGIDRFVRAVEARYNQASLEKLLHSSHAEARQAAVIALGRTATISVNRLLARALHDADSLVRELAVEALWSLWFQADAPEHNAELRRLSVLERETGEDPLPGLCELAKQAPRFAEVYNQRAIVHFRRGDYSRSATDCDRTLRLNPVHFGAASGMGQCCMKLRRYRAALRSFRRACRINPNLQGVREAIESLEKMLGEEGKR
ncbi:MAG: tetratricopeptide repeat protein [Gemmataceae bacterium]|nr:tetratricopeptide repeat protein [Gemmataceae bacterium]